LRRSSGATIVVRCMPVLWQFYHNAGVHDLTREA
jgi:hypothetical protein